jgi:hypothetical protein
MEGISSIGISEVSVNLNIFDAIPPEIILKLGLPVPILSCVLIGQEHQFEYFGEILPSVDIVGALDIHVGAQIIHELNSVIVLIVFQRIIEEVLIR